MEALPESLTTANGHVAVAEASIPAGPDVAGEIADLKQQLKEQADRIDELEEKLTAEGFTKLQQSALLYQADKELADPEKRMQFLKAMILKEP